MVEFRVQRWSDIDPNTPLTEQAIRARYQPAGHYRISRSRYPAGTSFGGRSVEGTFHVLDGAMRLSRGTSEVMLDKGDTVSYPGGDYELAVLGEREAVLVMVWPLPDRFWT